MLKDRVFERYLCITNLWEADSAFTVPWALTKPFIGSQPRFVRCGLLFGQVIATEAPPTHFGRDPVEAFYRCLSGCVPRARKIFVGPCAPLRLYHINDYVMEKTVVYAVVAFSKWLGEDRFSAWRLWSVATSATC